MLAVEGLRRPLADFAIEVPELRVSSGETFALLGPTGAGKSRFLEVVAGFAAPSSGRILVGGVDVTRLAPEKRQISILFQEAFLFPHLDVAGNLRFAGGPPALYDQLVDLLGLEPLLGKPVAVLSGGERQLTALARGLMAQPQALLLDEAFSAIDPQSRKKVLEAFRRVQDRFRITTLAVTHNFEEALSVASRLGIMLAGKLVQSGPPQEVFAHPATPEIARFLGAENLFAGTIRRLQPGSPSEGPFPALFRTGRVELHIMAEREGSGYVLVHPYDITVLRAPQESSALNQLPGTVREISLAGGLAQLAIDAGEEFRVSITPQSCRDLGLTAGSELCLSFKASAVRVF